MELGLYTDSVGHLSTEAALDLAVSLGLEAVEIAVGGQSSAPHLQASHLLEDHRARRRYQQALRTRGLRLAALNCSAWPMHPRDGGRHTETIRAAIRLAHEFEVDKIVTMSGTPGASPDAEVVHWVTFPWPAQNPDDPTAADIARVLAAQWEQAAAYWGEMAAYAASLGARRIALELHPMHLVYNVPSLQRLREAVGSVLGANVDPSHLFWQQMDPVAVVRALGDAVHHVHLKDVTFRPERLAVAGVLDLVPFEQPDERAWNFATVGEGHGAQFWADLIAALDEVGYDDVLSIENEDPRTSPEAGVTQAARFIEPILASAPARPVRQPNSR